MKAKYILIAVGFVVVFALGVIFGVYGPFKAKHNTVSNTDAGTDDVAAEELDTENYLKLFKTIGTADDGLELARQADAVVFESRGCTSGKEKWDIFYRKTQAQKPATILCAFYYTLDRDRVSSEYYMDNKDRYPLLYYYLLEFDGEKYTITARDSKEKEAELSETYAYLAHYTGKGLPQSLFDTYEYYVLVDDPKVTWDEIQSSMLSSVVPLSIRHKMVYRSYEGWKGDKAGMTDLSSEQDNTTQEAKVRIFNDFNKLDRIPFSIPEDVASLTHFYHAAWGDIDDDGEDELYLLGSGPLSGRFSFSIAVIDGNQHYCFWYVEDNLTAGIRFAEKDGRVVIVDNYPADFSKEGYNVYYDINYAWYNVDSEVLSTSVTRVVEVGRNGKYAHVNFFGIPGVLTRPEDKPSSSTSTE